MARAYALTMAAVRDAYIACWNAKYHYLVGRPIHVDPTIDTLWTTYPLASYPSGHSSSMAARAVVLGCLFPRDAPYFRSRAAENAASRVWAGIHFRSDSSAGVALGERVGKAVVACAYRRQRLAGQIPDARGWPERETSTPCAPRGVGVLVPDRLRLRR